MKLYFLLMIVPFLMHSQNGETIINGNSRLHYRTFGSGKPLLIINGGPGMKSNGFVPLAETLSKDYKTIIYDQRGTGKSTLDKTDSATITLDLMVADMEILRKHLKIDRWSILGHSFGGMLAAYYATKHPENIEGLIMSSSGGVDLELFNNPNLINEKLSKTEQDSLAYWNKKIREGDTSYRARLGRGMALAPAYVYNKKNVPIIAQRLTESNSTVTNLVWDDMNKIKFNCTPGLTTFTKPVLILQGKNDILEIKIAEKIRHAFKNSSLVLMDQCGHYGWLDAPELYFKSIKNFLNT